MNAHDGGGQRGRGSGANLRVGLACALGLLLPGCQPSGNAGPHESAPRAKSPPAAQAAPPTHAAPPAAPGAAELEFYRKALSSGVAEVAASEIAQRKASAHEVKQLAARLVHDQRALNERLRRSSGVTVEPPPAPEEAAAQERMRGLQGRAYDQAWLDYTAREHARSIALYETVAKGGQSAQVRALAASALPQLRAHAARIERLRDGTGNADSTEGR